MASEYTELSLAEDAVANSTEMLKAAKAEVARLERAIRQGRSDCVVLSSKYDAVKTFAVPSNAEMQWHVARGDIPPGEQALGILFVALCNPISWMGLCRAARWLGMHGLRGDVRWRVWNMFCYRAPMFPTPLTGRVLRTLRECAHGIYIQRCRSTESVLVGFKFAGGLANLGTDMPAEIERSKATDQGVHKNETDDLVQLRWNADFVQDGNLVYFSYHISEKSRRGCGKPECATATTLYNVTVHTKNASSLTVRYDQVCTSCGRACVRFPRPGASGTTYITLPRIFVSDVGSTSSRQFSDAFRSYMNDGTLSLPQPQWPRVLKRHGAQDDGTRTEERDLKRART